MKKILFAALLCGLFGHLPAVLAATDVAAHAVLLTKNTPYTAEQNAETTFKRPDGSPATTISNGRVYRDSEGRERTETLDATGAVKQVSFHDIDGNLYLLNPATMQATKLNLSVAPSATSAPKVMSSTRRALGNRDIDGVATEGTLTTWTVSADEAAKRPASTHSMESWRSRELGVSMELKTSSSIRTSVVTLRNVHREEPPAELMANALTGYTVVPAPAAPAAAIAAQ